MLLHAPKPDSRLHVADKISDCANGSSPIELDELYVYHFLRCEHGFLVAYFFFDINYRTNSSQMRLRYVSHLLFLFHAVVGRVLKSCRQTSRSPIH